MWGPCGRWPCGTCAGCEGPASQEPAVSSKRKGQEELTLFRSLCIPGWVSGSGHAYFGQLPAPRCDGQIITFPMLFRPYGHVSIPSLFSPFSQDPQDLQGTDLDSAKLQLPGTNCMSILSSLPFAPFLLINNWVTSNGIITIKWYLSTNKRKIRHFIILGGHHAL